MINKYIIVMILLVMVISGHIFYKKTYLAPELVYSIPEQVTGEEREFVYDGDDGHYEFHHSKESIDNSYFLNTARGGATFELRQSLPSISDQLGLNFDRYSYCVAYGRKVSSMYHSYKSTYFDDQSHSPFKCRERGKICVFLTYDSSSVRAMYIYRVKKNKLLRGFHYNG